MPEEKPMLLHEQVITRQDVLRDKLSGAMPPRGKRDVFVAGEMRGPNLITFADKPSGIVPGALAFMVDKTFIDNFNGAMKNVDQSADNYRNYWTHINEGTTLPAELKGIDYVCRRAYNDYCDHLEYDSKVKKADLPNYEGFLNEKLPAAIKINQQVAGSIAASSAVLAQRPDAAFRALQSVLKTQARNNPLIFTLAANETEQYNKEQVKNDPKTTKLTTLFFKMDYKDSAFTGRVSPSKRRAGRTNTARKAGEKAKAAVLTSSTAYKQALNKGQSKEEALETAKTDPKTVQKAESAAASARERIAVIHNTGKLFLEGDKLSQGMDAVLESIATKHAVESGMPAQFMQTFPGSWSGDSGTPKILTVSVWEQMRTFEDLCKSDSDLGFSLSIGGGKEGGTQLSDSSYLYYENAAGQQVSASHLVDDLGQQLALLMRHFDRDAMGKAAQNKGIRFVDDPANPGFQQVKMFGIDFGHAFSDPLKNPRDDFSFEQPTNSDLKNLVNYSSFYDTAYSKRMIGIQVMAKQHGIDVSDAVKASYPDVWNNPAIEAGSHKKPFEEELNYYQAKLADAQAVSKKSSFFSSSYQSAAREIDACKKIIGCIQDGYKVALENDAKLLETFEQRIHLTANQVDLLDHMEKLISNPSATSVDGKVHLNHLRVERDQRIPVQMVQDNGQPVLDKNGHYQLNIEAKTDTQRKEVVNTLTAYAADKGIELHVDAKTGIISVPPEQVGKFNEADIRNFLSLEAQVDKTPKMTSSKEPAVPLKIAVAEQATSQASLAPEVTTVNAQAEDMKYEDRKVSASFFEMEFDSLDSSSKFDQSFDASSEAPQVEIVAAPQRVSVTTASAESAINSPPTSGASGWKGTTPKIKTSEEKPADTASDLDIEPDSPTPSS